MSEDQTYFNKDWFTHEVYGEWLVQTKFNTQYRCKVCRKTNELSNMGIQALKTHSDGAKHKKNLKSVNNFFSNSKAPTPSPACVAEPDNETKKQTKLNDLVGSSVVADAEIRWILKCVSSGFSNNSNADTSKLFSVMFSDSVIADKFQLGADKLRYSINFGIGPHFKNILMGNIKESDFYVVSYDESLNSVTQTSEMDLLVRYFDKSTKQVHTRYVSSSFLGHARHADLFREFTSFSEDLLESKLIQISMDGPAVNWKFYEVLQQDRKEKGYPQLINIGSCGLHTIHGGFKTGAEKTDWNLKGVMKAAFTILHDSPARREDYESVTGSQTYPLPFCATRWVEDKPVADRLIEIWSCIKQLVNFWNGLVKSKQPSSKSFEVIKSSVRDELLVAKLGFFSYFADFFKPFLTAYQTDQPMTPFLYNDICTLLKNIFSVIVKPDVISKCETASQLKNILNNADNMLNTKEVNVGFVASKSIEKLKKKDQVSKTEVASFKSNVKKFVITTVNKILEKSPIGSVVVRNANAFDPKTILTSSSHELIKKVKSIMSHLIQLEWFNESYSDKVIFQYRDFLENEVKELHDRFQHYKRKDCRLDDFFFSICSIDSKYEELSAVLKIILTLSHGQSAVERSFSLGNSVVVDNISETSIINKKLIRDHLLANKLSADSIHISREMRNDYKAASTKYRIHLEQEKQKKVRSEKDNQKSIITEEMNVLKLKIEEAKKSIGFLEGEYVQAVKEAEVKNSMSYVKKANALKRKSDEDKEEIKSLEKTLSILEEKRAKI